MGKSAKMRILSRPFTRNQVKVSFQDHPPNVPKMDPKQILLRLSSLKMFQKRVLPRPLRMDLKMTLLSRPLVKMTKNQLLSRPLQIELKNLNPHYMVPVDEVSQVISDPQTRQKAQPVTEQPLSGPPPPGSRFNPIYVEPGSVSINSTRDLQVLFPNSFDCIGDMQGKYDIKTDPTVPPVPTQKMESSHQVQGGD